MAIGSAALRGRNSPGCSPTDVGQQSGLFSNLDSPGDQRLTCRARETHDPHCRPPQAPPLGLVCNTLSRRWIVYSAARHSQVQSPPSFAASSRTACRSTHRRGLLHEVHCARHFCARHFGTAACSARPCAPSSQIFKEQNSGLLPIPTAGLRLPASSRFHPQSAISLCGYVHTYTLLCASGQGQFCARPQNAVRRRGPDGGAPPPVNR